MSLIFEKLFRYYIEFMFSPLSSFLVSPIEKDEIVSDRPMGKPISYEEWLKRNGFDDAD